MFRFYNSKERTSLKLCILDNCLNYTNVTWKRIPDFYAAMKGVSPSSG